MKLKSTIIALLVGLSLISVACSKSAANMSDSKSGANVSGSNKSAVNRSDDDKFKLYEAAYATDDSKLVEQVGAAFGLTDPESPAFEKFIKDYQEWRVKNPDWVKQYSTDPQKAREYVKSHMP